MSASAQPESEAERVPEEDTDLRSFGRLPDGAPEVPLFLRGKSDGRKGDAQDEKDETEE